MPSSTNPHRYAYKILISLNFTVHYGYMPSLLQVDKVAYVGR